MSYEQKYLKYKNKYLALKSQYGYLLNSSESNLSTNNTNNLFNELNASDERNDNINVNIISNNLTGGANNEILTETETTIVKKMNEVTENSEEVSKLFKQLAGGKKEKPKKKNNAHKHFLNDDSDLNKSSDTLSEVVSDSDFSSSEIDW